MNGLKSLLVEIKQLLEDINENMITKEDIEEIRDILKKKKNPK